jgi:hypothetical protein
MSDAFDAIQDHEQIQRLMRARRRAELQAGQDDAVRQGLAPLAPSPASYLYIAPPAEPLASLAAARAKLGAIRAALPDVDQETDRQVGAWLDAEFTKKGRRKLAPRLCREDADHARRLDQEQDDELQAVIAQHGDFAQAQAHIDQRRAQLRASEDAAWERAKEQERACYLCDDQDTDPEPQGGAERRADVQPQARTVRLGARLEGAHLNVLVPSSTTPDDHIVTCREVKRGGVRLYVALDCTCADFAFRKRKTAKTPEQIPNPCKHMKQAARHAREQAVLEATR